MSDEEIVETLARFDGWKPETRKRYAGMAKVKGWGRNQHLRLGDFNREFTFELDDRWLTSRDELTSILAKLSEKQWENMLSFIFSGAWTHRSEAQKQRYLLTCPARVLAESIAAVVKEAR